MTTTTFDVTGMTCEHCERAVIEELSALAGVTSVSVDLVPNGTSHVTVTSKDALDAGAVAEAVDEAGYSLARPGDLPLA